ncbi:MAG TPA: urease accessory protein UreD [Micromonosporaceae bacterium]|nr:urease accessory protein UreD [Micromonosporaceae bacterium]
MRATARLLAVPDGGGGTRLGVLRSEPPLLLRRTGPRGASAEAQVHLVGGAAGPLGGDRLRLDVQVAAGARLCVRTVAASLALPGSTGDQSRFEVYATIADGGRLRWLPEPLIGAAGCDHLSTSTVELAEGAALVWREELVCGRHGEPVGDVRLRLTARYGGRTLLRNELAVGPRAPAWDGAAVLGEGRAVGSVLVVDPAWIGHKPLPSIVLGPTAAMMPLDTGPGMLASAVGVDLRAVRESLAAGDVSGETAGRACPPHRQIIAGHR